MTTLDDVESDIFGRATLTFLAKLLSETRQSRAVRFCYAAVAAVAALAALCQERERLVDGASRKSGLAARKGTTLLIKRLEVSWRLKAKMLPPTLSAASLALIYRLARVLAHEAAPLAVLTRSRWLAPICVRVFVAVCWLATSSTLLLLVLLNQSQLCCRPTVRLARLWSRVRLSLVPLPDLAWPTWRPSTT